MLKKLEKELHLLDLHKGQIDRVNLRGHVAAVSDRSSLDNARKSAKLIKAAVAEMAVLSPTPQQIARIEGPVMILGDGIDSFTAAQELSRNGIDFFLAVSSVDPEAVLCHIHHAYPGERQYYNRLKNIVSEVANSSFATVLPPGRHAPGG